MSAHNKTREELVKRAIPYIRPGWSVDDLKSVEDCDQAVALIQAALIHMEEELLRAQLHEEFADPDWYARVKTAIRKHKQLLSMVHNRRGDFTRKKRQAETMAENRLLLDEIKKMNPELFKKALELCSQKYPELFAA